MSKTYIYTFLFCLILGGGKLYSQDVAISPLSINTRLSDEMSPYLIDSMLIYTSDRKISAFTDYFDQDGNLLHHLFVSHLEPDGSWGKPALFDLELNSRFNNGPLCYSADKNTIFLTRNLFDSGKRKQKGNGMGIFVAEKNSSGAWGKLRSLPINSQADFNTFHPTITPDGRFLYFASDMDRGFGKSDIYVSEKLEGEWGPPENAGEKINTEGSEVFPFYHSSGKLYFASDGHGGMGGMDLFYVERTPDGWSDPVNLGEPYNSTEDDFAFTMTRDADWSIFSSNRSGNADIYRADPTFLSFDSIVPQQEIDYCGIFYEKKMQMIDTLRFSFDWNMGDGTQKNGIRIHHCFPGPGDYLVTLRVSDREGLIEDDYISTYQLNIPSRKQIYISSPDTVKINEPVTFSLERSSFDDFKPTEFYWNFGEGFNTKGRRVNRTFSLPGTYTVSCGTISGDDPEKKMCNSRIITVSE